MIERIGVVIPACNEEELLPACLDAVDAAVAECGLPTLVVVALDNCTDRSRAIVSAHPVASLVEVSAGKVGVARGAGAAAVLRWARRTPPARLWLATTDADSLVRSDWLRSQVALANAGCEVVLGTVEVADWSEHPESAATRWAATYRPVEDHPHVHGANFGCTAAAYVDVGGWPPRATDEDVAMAAALAHRRVIRTASIPVITSARRDPRAPGGFGDTLRSLAG
jgi:glycosyltransferase involved in cell wall biosynthesis